MLHRRLSVSKLKNGSASERLCDGAALLLLLLPVLLTFLYVRAFAVELPYFDDWGIGIPQLTHLETRSFRWSDLNVRHTESVVLFPQMVHLTAARLARYGVLVTMYISCMFLCGSLGVLFLFFRRLRLPGRWSILWFLPVSIFFMSWRQSEGLLWSTHLVNTMALFFSLLALYGCVRAQESIDFFGAAIASAWVATFSMASGVLIWPIGWLYLAISGSLAAPRAGMRRVAIWTVSGGVCLACFVLDRAPNSVGWRPGIAYLRSNLGTAGQYILIYFGSPFNHDPGWAIWAGAVFVLAAVLTVYFAVRKTVRQDGVLAAMMLIALVTLALGPLLAFRLDLGAEEAVSSRYVTLGSLAAIGVYFCLLALKPKTPAARYLLIVMAALFLPGVVDSYASGLEDGRENRAYEIQCAAIVRDFRHRAPAELQCANPDAEGILVYMRYLERRHLSLFQ